MSRSARRRLSFDTLESRQMLSGVVGDGAAAIEFVNVNDWGSGFQGQIRLVNDEQATIDTWQLEFDFDHEITDIWNATVVARDGDHYTIEHAPWNGTIDVGQAVTFGFIAGPGGVVEGPTNLVFNGIPVGDEPAQASISIGDAVVTEGESPAAQLTVTLSHAVDTTVSIDWTTGDLTATAGEDYAAAAGTLVFAPGQRSATIEIPILDDAAVESDEQFVVVLSSADGATIADGEALVTIHDTDTPPPVVPNISAGDAVVVEGDPQEAVGGWLHTEGNQIVDADGTPVKIAGVNWFGMESDT